MTKKFFIFIVASLVMINIIQSCENQSKDKLSKALLELNPPDELLEKGQQVFKANCDTCHPDGQEGVGPSLKNTNLSEEEIKNQVRNGGETMPPFTKHNISDEDLNALVYYIKNGISSE